jgi:hypothetical protein
MDIEVGHYHTLLISSSRVALRRFSSAVLLVLLVLLLLLRHLLLVCTIRTRAIERSYDEIIDAIAHESSNQKTSFIEGEMQKNKKDLPMLFFCTATSVGIGTVEFVGLCFLRHDFELSIALQGLDLKINYSFLVPSTKC